MKLYTILSYILLILFAIGMLKNLGNIAFWEDEGETIQLGKSILRFGYPSVFDGRSFILIDTNFHPKNFLRYTSPYLQFYLSAIAIFLFKNPANTFLMRLPFALSAILGIWISWFAFRKLKYSQFSLFLYTLFLSTSTQLYLYWRQTRHYALQFPLSLGLLYSYLNLGRRKWNFLFLILGFLFYHAYYPGFVGFYLGITVHVAIRKFLDKSYRLKPFITSTLILIAIHLPAALYLHHYGQLPNNGYLKTLIAYLVDLNYFAYFKIATISTLALVIVRILNLSKEKRQSAFKMDRHDLQKGLAMTLKTLNLKKIFYAHQFSFSLFSTVIPSLLFLASFGAHNQRYISVLIPYAFLFVAISWEALVSALACFYKHNIHFIQIASLPFLFLLVSYSHPKFIQEFQSFTQELQSNYVGPVEGIVNTINGVKKLKRIDPALPKQSDILIATNFEDGAIYSYLDNQSLNSLAPADQYKYGNRLPDWVIIRQHWGQEEYLRSFLKKGNYEKIETPYCDLSYENTYLVRTHQFETVKNCPEKELVLYRLIPISN